VPVGTYSLRYQQLLADKVLLMDHSKGIIAQMSDPSLRVVELTLSPSIFSLKLSATIFQSW